MSAQLRSEGYNVSYHCVPSISFIPEHGQVYLANSALSGDGRCGIEVVREDSASVTGVGIEPSVGPLSATSRADPTGPVLRQMQRPAVPQQGCGAAMKMHK